VERAPEAGMQTFRIEVGYVHGVKPGNIVGAIANEAGLEARHIGRIEIYDDYSTLDLPASMPDELLSHLKTVWVAGRQLHISRDDKMPQTQQMSHKGHPEHHAKKEEPPARKNERNTLRSAPGMQTYRIEVGHVHGVKPANIVGAIANEAGLDPKYIGRIDIHHDYSTLELPEGMPKEVFKQLKTVSVSGQQLHISHAPMLPQEEANFMGKKVASSAPRKGDDRKTPVKAKAGSGKRTTDAAKTKAKPHRKGPKSA
jgi:ATP-dependent RNA helicase DeaD